MRLEAKKYLYDIHQAVGLIASFTEGQTLADYEGDAVLRAAVERQFEIIGEALARMARLDEPLAERISEYRRIIAFRNIPDPRLRGDRPLHRLGHRRIQTAHLVPRGGGFAGGVAVWLKPPCY